MQGPQGLQGLKGDKGDKGDAGPQGPPGAFPGVISATGGNNGTASCDLFCSNPAGTWGARTGTCVGAKLLITSSALQALNGKYVSCSVRPADTMDWNNPGPDAVMCYCIIYP